MVAVSYGQIYLQSDPEPEPYQFPPSTKSEGQNLFFLKTVDLTGKFYTDKIGQFPITSRKGNKYILVAYHYYSNTIHVGPLKTETGLELKTAHHKLHNIYFLNACLGKLMKICVVPAGPVYIQILFIRLTF